MPAGAAALSKTGSGRALPGKKGAATRVQPRIVPQPSVTYLEVGGITGFKPRDAAEGFQQEVVDLTPNGPYALGIRPTTSAGYFVASMPIPGGSLLTEFYYTYFNNDVNGVNLEIDFMDAGNDTLMFFDNNVTQDNGNLQTWSLAFTPVPITTDSFVIPYFGFNVVASDQVLISARAGFVLAPGVTLFPTPWRVVSINAPVPAGYYGPFDATADVVATPTGVPAGATAAYCNVQSYQSGVMTLFPDNGTVNGNDPHIWNWSGPGTSTSNPVGKPLNQQWMMVPLGSNGKFRIHTYFSGQIFVDVWGYAVSQ